MKDINHRGRQGKFLPGEKEEAWETAIREAEEKDMKGETKHGV